MGGIMMRDDDLFRSGDSVNNNNNNNIEAADETTMRTNQSSSPSSPSSSPSSLPSLPQPQAPSDTKTARRLSPQNFTFSNFDLFQHSVSNRQQQLLQKLSTNNNNTKKNKRRRNKKHHSPCLWGAFMAILLCQCILFLFQASISNYYHYHYHYHNDNDNDNDNDNSMEISHYGGVGLTLFLSKSSLSLSSSSYHNKIGNKNNIGMDTTNIDQTSGSTITIIHRPRLLIGLFSDYGSDGSGAHGGGGSNQPGSRISSGGGGSTNSNSKTYRNRHRKLFQLWNDTRLCPYNAFRQRQRQRQRRLLASKQDPNNHKSNLDLNDDDDYDDDECLILYTFVIGAHRRNTNNDDDNNNKEASSTSNSNSSNYNNNNGDEIPTLRLEGTRDEPLEIELGTASLSSNVNPNITAQISKNLPLDLIRHRDYTLLNIRENMNDGKSPSFFAWAHSEATSPRNTIEGHSMFSYAAKCDLDAMLRLDFVLQVLHRDLIWIPNHVTSPMNIPASTEQPAIVSSKDQALPNHATITTPLKTDPTSVGGIVLGCLRHKAMWADTTKDDFWRANYQNGMHLYLGGQFYIVSVNLIPGLVQEAQVQQLKHGMQSTGDNYMAGHEDHDVLSMIQAASIKNGQLVRWISMPRNYRFWEHPVKGEMWWKRIWKRESRKAAEGKLPSRNKYSLPVAPKGLPSLLIVLGAADPKDRVSYRDKLITEQHRGGKRICSLMDYRTADASTVRCDLVYTFVVGGNDKGPNEIVRGEDRIELDDFHKGEKDLLMLNIRDNTNSGMGQTVLFHLQNILESKLETSFDMVVFCNAQTVLSVEQWNRVQYQQTRSHRNLIVGDIRDKDQLPVEFGTERRNETYFFLEQENIHVYPGSDNACFAVSTNLVDNMLRHANESFGLSKGVKVIREDSSRKRKFKIFNPRAYFVQNLGYDLTTLAYMTPFTVLHWVPISKGQAPWYTL
ncbi:unnamed protein product [Cylindrotheca closterium]|uniref:Uncharacterized protein n=1 Tax=Cylindrotheca closterium TaxID=2856 RepID=A0AAD2FEF5_9STRA|nr:unnamed protein product [Cylindrotheca closterium]